MNRQWMWCLCFGLALILLRSPAHAQFGDHCKDEPSIHAEPKILVQEAEKGNAVAQYLFGRFANNKTVFAPPSGMPKKEDIVLEMYQRSANQGYIEAQHTLFHHYYKKKEYEEALFWAILGSEPKWIRRVSEELTADQIDAAHTRAHNWKPKYENPPELTPELRELKRKAESGDVDAAFMLGNAYTEPYDTSNCDDPPEHIRDPIYRNLYEAHKWWMVAASQGHPRAAYSLGETYWINTDYKAAEKWCRVAAIRGNLNCEGRLAHAIVEYRKLDKSKTNYVPKYEEALFWIIKNGRFGPLKKDEKTDSETVNFILERLSEEQIARVEGLVHEWWKHPTNLEDFITKNFPR